MAIAPARHNEGDQGGDDGKARRKSDRRRQKGIKTQSIHLVRGMNIHDISNLGERCETSVAGRQDWGHVGAVLAAAQVSSERKSWASSGREREPDKERLTHSSNTYC